jgi:molecular chaperone DnaK
MRKEAETNAETDRKRKDLIEVKNRADNTIYTAEKSLKDLGDKVPADVKQQTEDGIKKLREVLSGEDVEVIRRETDALGEVIQKIGSSVYQQTAGEPPKPEGETGDTTPPPDTDGGAGGDDVVDGEFKQV